MPKKQEKAVNEVTYEMKKKITFHTGRQLDALIDKIEFNHQHVSTLTVTKQHEETETDS